MVAVCSSSTTVRCRNGKMKVATIFGSVLLLAGSSLAQVQNLAEKDTLSAAKLSPQERRQILAVVDESAYDTPDSWDEELRAKRIDLGGSPGIVLRGTNLLCGATGNCQLFVLRKANNSWVSLFGREEAP